MEKKTFFDGRWEVVEEIGSGTTGTVYKAINSRGGVKSYSAIKEILLPKSKKEILSMYSQGATDSDISEYFENKAQEWIAKEVNFLEQFKGNPNIVAIEDHDVLDREDMIGKIVVIRMELLETLEDYILTHPVTDKDILKMGLDILNALEDCEEKNVLHRDIKPQNVFVNRNKIFKLGDFSESKEIEKTVSNMTQRGTPNYMAPELYKGERGSKSLDTYSLGIMLYQYFNNNKLPFMPEKYKYEDIEKVLNRRMSGEELPSPRNANEEISRIILKACSYKPEDRYESAMEFRNDLEKVYKNIKNPKVLINEEATKEEKNIIENNSDKDLDDQKKSKKSEQFGDTIDDLMKKEVKQQPKKTASLHNDTLNDTLGIYSDSENIQTTKSKKKEQFGETMDNSSKEEEKELTKKSKQLEQENNIKKKKNNNETIGIYTDSIDNTSIKKKAKKTQFGETIEQEEVEDTYEDDTELTEDIIISQDDIYEVHKLGDLEYKIIKKYQKEDNRYSYNSKNIQLEVDASISSIKEEEYIKKILRKEVIIKEDDPGPNYEWVKDQFIVDFKYNIVSKKDLVINNVIWKELILSSEKNENSDSIKEGNESCYTYKYIYFRKSNNVYYKVEFRINSKDDTLNQNFISVILSNLSLYLKKPDNITDDMEKIRTVTNEQLQDVMKLFDEKLMEKERKKKEEEIRKKEREKVLKQYVEISPTLGKLLIWFDNFSGAILSLGCGIIIFGLVISIFGFYVIGLPLFGYGIMAEILLFFILGGIGELIEHPLKKKLEKRNGEKRK